MADLNIRNMHPGLIAKLKADAALAGSTLRDHCIFLLSGQAMPEAPRKNAEPEAGSVAFVEADPDPILTSLRAALAPQTPIGSQVVTEEPEELPMCDYKEWDGEAGEFFRCALRKHGPKTKHVRGQMR